MHFTRPYIIDVPEKEGAKWTEIYRLMAPLLDDGGREPTLKQKTPNRVAAPLCSTREFDKLVIVNH